MRPIILNKVHDLWVPHISVTPFAFNLQLFAANQRYINFATGSNQTGDGSIGSPWKECPGTQNPIGSNTSGWTSIPASTEILFAAGQTWTRPILINSTWFANGSSGNEITLKSNSTSTKAIIDVSGYTTNAYMIYINSRDYIQIEYFELKNLSYAGECWGIFNYSSDYCKVLYNSIHDILNSSGDDSWCYDENTGSHCEIAYNNMKNAEIKIMEFWHSSYQSVHHNLIHDDVGFTGNGLDHGVVFTSDYGEFYNNILWTDKEPSTNGFAFKVDGNGYGIGNKIYNNLVLKWPAGMAAMDCSTGGNIFAQNTIYCQNQPRGSSNAWDCNGFTLDGTCNNNVFRNNIIYYVRLNSSDGYSTIFWLKPASATMAGNTITNNLVYYDGSNERCYIYGLTPATRTLAWLETNGNWHGVNGNVAENNIIANPGFSGGNHVVSDLPTGFDESWYPNDNGLELAVGSNALDVGYTMGAPYNVDIKGVSRPQDVAYDIGAYEKESGTPPKRVLILKS